MPTTNNMQEKHSHTTLLDEKKMEEAVPPHQQRVDLWEPEDEYPRPSFSTQSFQHVLIFALFCSNIFFAALAVFFYTNAQCPVLPHRLDPFSISAASRDARAHIRYEQRTFTGALKYNSTTGNLYRSGSTANSTEPQYVGNPRTTPGLDRAWKDLLSGSRFPLSDEEVIPYLKKDLATTSSTTSSTANAKKVVSTSTGTTSNTITTVYAELDVFHSLSCLNAIRLALDDDFYAEHGPQDGLGWQRTTRSDREQLDYCLDHLRQSLQCSADLSIVPMIPRGGSGSSSLEFAAPSRTCRRWDDVRSWVDRRQERSRFGSSSTAAARQRQQLLSQASEQQYSGV